eukprot:4454100-Pleurochrysis_carterae.AAC.1
MLNIYAAQSWECPCIDWRNCIGSERIKSERIYDYRKLFQTTNISDGGKRDASVRSSKTTTSLPLANSREASSSARSMTA